MTDLINLLTQNGIGIVCVAFMIYFITHTLEKNNEILDKIQQTLVAIQVNLDNLSIRMDTIESKIKKEVKKNDTDE